MTNTLIKFLISLAMIIVFESCTSSHFVSECSEANPWEDLTVRTKGGNLYELTNWQCDSSGNVTGRSEGDFMASWVTVPQDSVQKIETKRFDAGKSLLFLGIVVVIDVIVVLLMEPIRKLYEARPAK